MDEIKQLKDWCGNIDLDKAALRNELNTRCSKLENEVRTIGNLIHAFTDAVTQLRKEVENTEARPEKKIKDSSVKIEPKDIRANDFVYKKVNAKPEKVLKWFWK